jgi:thiol-disulfide isomerase/thioredoxin
MMKTRIGTVFLGTLAMLFAAGAMADLGKAEVGSEMPNFKLTDYTGTTHQLSDYKGKVVVIDFLSDSCPWSRGAAPSIAKLAKQYEGNDVIFIGVNSNKGATPEAMKDLAVEMGIEYPIAIDEQNEYADTVGATRTPEIFIVDRDGTLAYHGAYDNRKAPKMVGDVNYARDAIDALLAGNRVTKPEVSAWGCTIKRAPKKLS